MNEPDMNSVPDPSPTLPPSGDPAPSRPTTGRLSFAEPADGESTIADLEGRVKDYVATPEAKAALQRIGPEHRRPGSALPRVVRRAPEHLQPNGPMGVSAAVHRVLAETVQLRLTKQLEGLNGWAATARPFTLGELVAGRRRRTDKHDAAPTGTSHMELRRPLHFAAQGRPVAMVVFPYATPEQARAFAASVGLVAHIMPPDGRYMPRAGARGPGAPIAVAITRPDVAGVSWPVDPAGADDWSAESIEAQEQKGASAEEPGTEEGE